MSNLTGTLIVNVNYGVPNGMAAIRMIWTHLKANIVSYSDEQLISAHI